MEKDIMNDLSEAKVRVVIAEQLTPLGYSFTQEDPGEYCVLLHAGRLGFRFVWMKEDGGEGIFEVHWTGRQAEGAGMPPWKFRWQDGVLDEHESARFGHLLQWVHRMSDEAAIQAPVYSRCREESIGFPLLSGGERKVPVREIIYLQAERDWTRLLTGHGPQKESLLLDRSIGKCARDLESFGFMRIHRGFVVNTGCIRRCMDQGLKNQVELCDGSLVPVARRRCAELRERLAAIRARQCHLSENFEQADNT